jgi:radical SAM superfamily enzyme YgiQ (UPF0313 family)
MKSMKIVWVAFGQEQYGISILSAVLREAGHESALVFDPALFHDRYYFDVPVLRDIFNRDAEVVEEIVREKPDLIAFSVLTVTYQWCLDIARQARARLGVPVVFGGVHPSAVPEVCLENECVDYVCVGEGEEALLRLCDALATGATRPSQPIPNLWWRETPDPGAPIVRGPAAPFLQDLDALPMPDKALWEGYVRIQDSYLIMTARGCPYRCTFCFNNFYAKIPKRGGAPGGGGKYVRQRSIERVLEELVTMKRRYRYRRVQIEDDIFTLDKKWIRAFLDRYAQEVAVPFRCLVHPRYMDRDLARWLKDAGCDQIQMGIQSADEEYKRKQLLRMERDSHLESSLAAMKEAGLTMKLDHIFGLPGEPPESQEKARDLFARIAPARINTFWLSYLPGLDLTKEAHRAGLLSEEQLGRIDRGTTSFFHHGDRWNDDGRTLRFYQRYDVLFRLMPLLPDGIRHRLRPEHVPDVPGGVARGVGFAADLVNSLLRGDEEMTTYARHYAWHLAKATPGILRSVARRRTPPRGAGPRVPRAPSAHPSAAEARVA